MKTTKIMTFVLALIMAFTLAACDSSGETPSGGTPSPSGTSETQTPGTSSPAPNNSSGTEQPHETEINYDRLRISNESTGNQMFSIYLAMPHDGPFRMEVYLDDKQLTATVDRSDNPRAISGDFYDSGERIQSTGTGSNDPYGVCIQFFGAAFGQSINFDGFTTIIVRYTDGDGNVFSHEYDYQEVFVSPEDAQLWYDGVRNDYEHGGTTYAPPPVPPLLAADGSINFPDPNFENIVRAIIGKPQGGIKPIDVAAVTSINTNDYYDWRDYIVSFSGLEYFTALVNLHIQNGNYSTLDVSNLPALTALNIFNAMQLKMINANGNATLKTINLDTPALAFLEVQGCSALERITIGGGRLTTLDLSNLSSLKEVMIGDTLLNSINISGNNALETIDLHYNQLTTLDASGLSALTHLGVTFNSLTTLNMRGSTALTSIDVGNNQLTTLDVSGFTALKSFHCANNKLTSLNVSGCTSLTDLSCYDNQLTSLDASGLTSLVQFDVFNNNLTSLNISGCTKLYTLTCQDNRLSTLDVSNLRELRFLYCYNNNFSSKAAIVGLDEYDPDNGKRGITAVVFDPQN
jgi:hypothetical protein